MTYGTLYGIGVGPGDPELMTLKAVRLIRQCPVIAVPRSGAGEVAAWNIARQAVPELEEKQRLELDMPMTRDAARLEAAHAAAAQAVEQCLRAGQDVAFLTLGDPTVYSTYAYLHKRVRQAGLEAQMVPGVPSFCAAAARLGKSLAEGAQPFHVIPASYEGTEAYLDWPGPKVLMKTGRCYQQVAQALRERGLEKKTALVKRCGMEGEEVYPTLEQVTGEAAYFSILLVDQPE